MGLFKKVKDILFDEEEYTEQIKITPEMRNEQVAPKEVDKTEEKVVPTSSLKEDKSVQSEKEVFRSNSYPFLDFDEEEFEEAKPQTPKPIETPKPIQKPTNRYNNVLDYERKKKIERRTDYGRYEKIETVETIERKKFKPSPIISPVYGVLDKDYRNEDIEKYENKVDIQKVRDKAFGEVKEKPEVKTFYDQSETVTLSKPQEKEEKAKTIDELLEETSDVIVDIDNDLENELKDVEEKIQYKPINDEVTKEVPKVDESEDTLESDLFDLIDSMYDKKEGE